MQAPFLSMLEAHAYKLLNDYGFLRDELDRIVVYQMLDIS